MEDREFFDRLYQGWAKTTGAENTFWMPEEDAMGVLGIYSVDEGQNKNLIADNVREADAAFITALHGCFGDLVKRLHDALDEAERLSVERDEQEGTIAELTIRNMELEQELADVRSS